MHFRLTQEDPAWAFEWFGIADTRLRQIVAAVLLVVGVGVLCPQMHAADPVEPQKLTSWFCSSLDGPFDFPKLTKTFPFERLGEVTTTRKPVGSDSTATSVEQTAQGESFTVAYGYQYKNDDVSSHYGFWIQVRRHNVDINQDPDIFPKSWLTSIGKVEYQAMGPAVGMGEKSPLYMGYTAYFSYWPSTGTMVMNWFQAGDTSKFSAVCKKQKQ
jgi:hypothetical protein